MDAYGDAYGGRLSKLDYTLTHTYPDTLNRYAGYSRDMQAYETLG